MKKAILTILIALYITGCASAGPTPSPTATHLPSPTSSPLPTLTATPLPTRTPQPTQTSVVVKDLDPLYTESIGQEYMGVQITTKLITDESLSRSNPRITEISINPNFYNYKGEKSETAIADFIAMTIFKAWWKKGEIEHKENPTEADFEDFMETWSLAQKENDPSFWRKVQFSVYANDLNTQGYTQEKVTIWPMYTGSESPDEVIAVDEINIVFVRGPRMENFTPDSKTGEYYGDGHGANFEGNKLYLYVGIGYGYGNPANTANLIVSDAAQIPMFLISNNGKAVRTKGTDAAIKDLYELLCTPRRRCAIKVFPPSIYEKQQNP